MYNELCVQFFLLLFMSLREVSDFLKTHWKDCTTLNATFTNEFANLSKCRDYPKPPTSRFWFWVSTHEINYISLTRQLVKMEKYIWLILKGEPNSGNSFQLFLYQSNIGQHKYFTRRRYQQQTRHSLQLLLARMEFVSQSNSAISILPTIDFGFRLN